MAKRPIKILIFIVFFISLYSAFTLSAGEKTLFRDDFNNLDNWEPLYFPKIKEHSTYTIESMGQDKYLKAQSDASASGLVYKSEFNVYDYPNLRWSWMIENVFKKGDAKSKKGDDYPIRIYVMFKYDPKKAGFGERIKYNTAKTLYGEYPPHSSLNYIWANKEHPERIITSSYTDKSKMILLQKGDSNIKKWQVEKVNIIADYREAFGEDPPQIATLGIMNDSDNTGEKAISYIDFIEIYGKD